MDALYWQNMESQVCWQPVSHQSRWFPSFQSHWHPEFSASELHSLGVDLVDLPMQHLIAQVRPWSIPKISERTWWRHNGNRETLIRFPMPSRLALIAKTGQDIANWVDQHVPKAHALRVGFCGNSLEGYLKNWTIPCPFCLAFSMWWCIVTQRYFNPKRAVRSAHFMFTKSVGYRTWSALTERVLLYICDRENPSFHDRYYRPDLWFQRWFYQRSLQLIFCELFELASFLVHRYSECRLKKNPIAWDHRNHYKRAWKSSAMIAGGFEKDRINVWCTNENPLDNLQPGFPEATHYLHQDGLAGDAFLRDVDWDPDNMAVWSADSFPEVFEKTALDLHEWGWNSPWSRQKWYRLEN
ncbi:hypothetical protein [Marinobacter salicampi]|uniref:hypothetical protein n=1 Tax=Marinobacter salicampi TaxID=435907 RepID=UPI001407AA32|nr:hypothetical protein [Marinobacter salicampi]